jgi:hypothetical protein
MTTLLRDIHVFFLLFLRTCVFVRMYSLQCVDINCENIAIAAWLNNVYIIRREEVYSDAETFRPERFLEKTIDSNLYKFAPFIYGPRQCLGYRFALIEMRTMLALLLRHFRFDLDPTLPSYRRTFALTMRPSPSLKLRVALVNEKNVE